MSTRPNDSSPSSSSYAGQPNPQDDLAWLDFLRTAGGTVPPPFDRSNSADRKRRHTGSEPERRNYIYPYSTDTGGHSLAGQTGSSRQNPIDLSSPPRLSHPSMSRTAQGSRGNSSSNITTDRRDSDASLPQWQPDHTVLACPVCNTEFSFLFRRHHCRKCGRVVCANCSPHRITIPRQYIVQPANPYFDDEAYPVDNTANPALGGGEVVRVCNPCVPDPWTPAVAAPGPAPAPPPTSNRDIAAGQVRTDSTLHLQPDPSSRVGTDRERPERYRYVSEHVAGRNRSHTHHLAPSLHSTQGQTGAALPYSNPGRYRPLPQTPQRPHRDSHGNGGPVAPPDWSQRPFVPTAAPPAPPPAPAPPRREVREEDECPVCGMEMPTGEIPREAHIQECIAARFSSTPTQQIPLAPPAADIVSASAPSGSTPPISANSRPRATSYRPRGMALYRATEKDCLTEEGEPQECVICFEEFQPGDEMGRMECLCKFHRLCIRQWWDTKGSGSCPTHQLHD